ncbi:hypothetical protein MES4922_30362 [Mesorhizobium ventifaucium]|uniref:Uncharacterized protein n=1 Tax=Mesorhizobium ventifaucium TaxID=666020 RepID=A0ABN8JWD6_9HYPH|nr:hypothetical protein MES4922_30362 [Mesorhizobium ventifaucium]
MTEKSAGIFLADSQSRRMGGGDKSLLTSDHHTHTTLSWTSIHQTTLPGPRVCCRA